MQKNSIILLGCFLCCPVMAQEISALDEAALLGSMAGVAKACGENEQKLEDFELIAARLIANKTNSPEEEIMGYRRYAEENLASMRKHKENPQLSCDEILERFENMPIFESIVYQDGSLKLSDGTFLQAKRPPAKLVKKDQ